MESSTHRSRCATGALKGPVGLGAVILGGGLAGLSAGYCLTKAGMKVVLFEADSSIGGLSKTLRFGDFLFDIGGHRFFTKDASVDALVRGLMGPELVTVHRKSKIYMRGRFFDYPLKPANAVFGLGAGTVFKILSDYSIQILRRLRGGGRCVSLEDWVVLNFGRTMFDIYFREYSEKVWGIDCSRISQGWVAKRIEGLSLGKAVKNAVFKFTGRGIPTLLDTFLYPERGIGRISERLGEEISRTNEVRTGCAASRLVHDGVRIVGAEIDTKGGPMFAEAEHFVSTVPLSALVGMLDPAAPSSVAGAAQRLGYRDLVLVAVKVDRPSVTDQTWVYIPEKKIPFGRLHEPKSWSPRMADEERTLVVVEYFCFRGDGIWSESDEALSSTTVGGLEALGFLDKRDVIGTMVVRVPRAYPLFEVGYEDNCSIIYEYLDRFENLRIAGRSGTFQYQNMDHAILSGMEAAGRVVEGAAR